MMKKTISIAILVLVSINFANAQIKVVGGDYSSSLTGAKSYYEQDVDFEKIFPTAKLGEQIKSIEATLDLKNNYLGDTLWNYSDIKIDGYSLHNKIEFYGFGVASGNYGSSVIFDMPTGYYVVSGYIIGRENVADLVARYFNAEDTTRILHYLEYYAGGAFKDYGNGGVGKTSTIKQLKESILTSRLHREDFREYIGFVKLSSVDSIDGKHIDYYVRGLSKQFNVRFYNEIVKQFLNQEIIIAGCNTVVIRQNDTNVYSRVNISLDPLDQIITSFSWGEGQIMVDAMSGEKLKLHDSVFLVKDVVVKLEKERDVNRKEYDVPRLYIIVEGATTGKFAIHPKSIKYDYNVEYDLSEDYDVFSDYYSNFSIPRLEFDVYYPYNNTIIKKSDLNKLKQFIIDTGNTILNRERVDKKQEEMERIANQKRIEQEKIKQKEEFKQRMTSKYGAEMASLICDKRITIGMSQEMCRDAWGRPMNTYRTTTKYGQSEVWCYNYKTRIYFYNGKVVQIDD